MRDKSIFVDTNVLCYLFGYDARKAARAEEIVRSGGLISTQVLSELTNVAQRKAKLPWKQIDLILDLVCAAFEVKPLTLGVFQSAKALAARHQFHIYDAQIIAAALESGAATLWSEDMQHGQVFDGQVTVMNPFQ
jgi:predicted nucleic acid-binding protein